jgi:hypothetical protein
MPETINVDEMTAEQVRAFRGDQYQNRENAQAVVERCNQNIQVSNARLEQLEAEEKTPKVDSSKHK